MRPRPARVVAIASAIATAGCFSTAPYRCTEASQCQSGRTLGTCEAEGYCSFPDHACPSGRRFGTLAPASLAGECVEPETSVGDDTSSSADEGPATSGGSTPADPETGTETGGADDPSPPLGASSEGSDSTSGDEPVHDGSTDESSTSTSTTGLDEGCVHAVVDDFEDGDVAAAWTLNPADASVDESGGQLAITTPGPVAHTIVTRVLTASLLDGYVRVARSDVADVAGAYGGVIAAAPGWDFQLYAEHGWLQAYLHRAAGGSGVLGDAALPDERPVWLQVRRDGDGVVYFEVSTDEEQWTEVASAFLPECGDPDVPHTIGVFAGGTSATHRFDEISTCVLP